MIKRIFLGLFLSLFLSFSSFADTKLKVIQFNTWGVPMAVKDTFRYEEAMSAIETLDPDVVVLEEVFSGKGKRAFHSEKYPYETNGPRANLLKLKLVSSGIRILSKFPIEYSATTTFQHCLKDDCLSRKGAVLAVLELPNQEHLNLVAAHLNARGGDDVRETQIDQIKELIEDAGDAEAATLLVGDFNFNPESGAYPYLLNSLGMKDTWTSTHNSSDLGISYDAEANHYAHDYCIQTHFPLNRERIDFLFTKSGTNFGILSKSSHLIFNSEPLYSDHYGVAAEYEIQSFMNSK